MENFSTNMAIQKSMHSANEQTKINKPVVLSKEIQKKIQLIKKAFR